MAKGEVLLKAPFRKPQCLVASVRILHATTNADNAVVEN